MFFANPAICTSADLNVLSNPSPDSASPFFGVFPHRNGWYADFFHMRLSPYCESPRLAARHAAAWWRTVYGDAWATVFRGRKSDGWQVLKDAGGDGYRVLVWVVETPGLAIFHRPGVWYLRPKGEDIIAAHRGTVPDWLTAGEARDAYRRWVWQTFGIFSPYAGIFLKRPPKLKDELRDPAGSPRRRKMKATLTR